MLSQFKWEKASYLSSLAFLRPLPAILIMTQCLDYLEQVKESGIHSVALQVAIQHFTTPLQQSP